MDIRRLVGGNVRRCREAAGLSQEELAARLDVDQAYVSRLEAGRMNPTLLTVWHVCQALSIQPGRLFEAATAVTTKRVKRRKRVARS
jgi:transcriptional regulator with XRE-family HTH domain